MSHDISVNKFEIGDMVTAHPNRHGGDFLRNKKAQILSTIDLTPTAGSGWVYSIEMEDGKIEEGVPENVLMKIESKS